MALNYRSTYPDGTEDNADYPRGKAKNVSAPGAGDGFPFEKGFINDVLGFFQKIMNIAGITPSGTPDSVAASDYYNSLVFISDASAKNPANISTAIHGTSEKAVLVDADEVGILDSASSYAVKFITWLSLKIQIGQVARLPIGVIVSNNAGDATNDLDFSTGVQRDSTNLYNIVVSAARTKQADANWAAGTNAGMRASGASAWGAAVWHVFVIGKSTDPTAYDFVMDTSLTCVNGLADAGPSGFDIYKRIFSMKTSGAAWLAFDYTQLAIGLIRVLLKTPLYQFDKDWAGVDDAAQTGTLGSVPTGIKVEALLGGVFRDATPGALSALLVTSLDQTDTAASGVAGSYVGTYFLAASGATVPGGSAGPCKVKTSTSGTFRYRSAASTADHAAAFMLQGWEDPIL